MKCIICKKESIYENNAYPVREGKCCDECNFYIVIPARLRKLKNLK